MRPFRYIHPIPGGFINDRSRQRWRQKGWRNGERLAQAALGTSLPAIAALGWRHVATVTGTTVVILVVVTAGLAMMR